MLNASQELAALLQALENCELPHEGWRSQYVGMKSEEARRLMEPEYENKRLKQMVANLSLDNQMLKHVNSKKLSSMTMLAPLAGPSRK